MVDVDAFGRDAEPGERLTLAIEKWSTDEELVVALAVDVLAAKGWLQDDPDPELLGDLHRLYRANPAQRRSSASAAEMPARM